MSLLGTEVLCISTEKPKKQEQAPDYVSSHVGFTPDVPVWKASTQGTVL